MPKPIPMILVGTGDYYKSIVGPSLDALERRGRLKLLATVSRSASGRVESAPHRIRKPNQPLSNLLSDLQTKNAVVLLAHSNEQHTPDAIELISAGWRVMLEKPYAVNRRQLQQLERLIREHPHKLVLLEYYLMMKAAPLLVLAGKIRARSFYHTQRGLLKPQKALYALQSSVAGRSHLQRLLGDPRFVLVDVLEGKGATGRLEHRGIGLVDSQRGGGMLQDLGLHAVGTLFALEDYLGRIDTALETATVHTGRARGYMNTMRKQFALPSPRIAETYGRIRCQTATGVPIEITVGKYLPKNRNQRRLQLVGSTGSLTLDLNSCQLSYQRANTPEQLLLECPKRPESKYVPVLEAGLSILSGKSPFTFELSKVVLNAQRFILERIKQSKTDPQNQNCFYPTGVIPADRPSNRYA